MTFWEKNFQMHIYHVIAEMPVYCLPTRNHGEIIHALIKSLFLLLQIVFFLFKDTSPAFIVFFLLHQFFIFPGTVLSTFKKKIVWFLFLNTSYQHTTFIFSLFSKTRWMSCLYYLKLFSCFVKPNEVWFCFFSTPPKLPLSAMTFPLFTSMIHFLSLCDLDN